MFEQEQLKIRHMKWRREYRRHLIFQGVSVGKFKRILKMEKIRIRERHSREKSDVERRVLLLCYCLFSN